MDKNPFDTNPFVDPPGPDSGLACLLLLARLHGMALDAAQLRHRYSNGSRPLGAEELLRAARASGLRASCRSGIAADLERLPLPAMAECSDGAWLLLARVSGDRVLLQEVGAAQPRIMSREDFAGQWTGRVLLATRRGSFAADQGFGIGWFLRAAQPYKRLFVEILVASAVVQILGLVTPLFFQVVVDKVLVHKVQSTLQVLVLGLLLVSVFETLLGALRAWLLAHTTTRMDVVLGAHLFRHLLALPIGYFEARRVGDVVARVRELETVRAFVTGSALTLLIDLGFTVIVFGVMYLYSPLLCALVALSLPLYLALSLLAAPLLRAQAEHKFRLGADNQSFLVESVTGIATLKAMALEPPLQRRWEEQLAAYVSASLRFSQTATWSAQAATLINRLVAVAILWFGAAAVIDGSLSVGQLIAFNMLAMRVGSPVLRLFQLRQDFQQARVALARLGDILQVPIEGAGRVANAALGRIVGDIRVQGMSFRYDPERAAALTEFELHIRAGEVLGIVGRSGSGKSTLARLLQRLYQPQQGRILIDGCDIALISPESLRRQIAVVPQECFLFNASVRENIAPGDPGMPLERVIDAARLAGAHEFICELPYGYDTPLGEQAHVLSGGQRQRIAIARALLRDPRILIFDEATSALDYESEEAIRRRLAAICAGRTVLVIAHRLTALSHCGRIIVLEHGRIVEQGTHAELQACNGIYSRLCALQSMVRVA